MTVQYVKELLIQIREVWIDLYDLFWQLHFVI